MINTFRGFTQGLSLPAGARGRASTFAVLAVLVLSQSACQRRTEDLPPAPIFEMRGPAAPPPIQAPPPRSFGPLPGGDDDFLKFVGTDTVFFDKDSVELTAEARAVLDREAMWLLKYPQTRAMIEGHSDERGTREFSFGLGEARAAAIKFYLGIRGVVPERIAITSYGKDRPAVAGSDRQSWRANRRGQTIIIRTN